MSCDKVACFNAYRLSPIAYRLETLKTLKTL